MDKEFIELGIREGRIFKIGYGFYFAAQVPDNTVGRSGSRCSYCNAKNVYCEQVCKHCSLPFIGPFYFPQLPEWEAIEPDERRRLVEEIYCHKSNRGRLLCTNVADVPLTREELREVEKIQFHDADLFRSSHGMPPQKIKEILYIRDNNMQVGDLPQTEKG